MVKEIRYWCKKRGITVAALERELGFGNGTIRKWDDNLPSLERVKKVADRLDVAIISLTAPFPDEKIPQPKEAEGINEQLIRHLSLLTEEETKQVDDFVQFLLTKRGV